MPLVYAELKQHARHYLRGERAGHMVDATSLVNEVFVRLMGGGDVSWQERAHFFGVSARIMRRILVDRARARGTAKRGNSPPLIDLNEAIHCAEVQPRELIALDNALTELEKVDPRKAKVIELRFFAGLSVEESAEVLGVHPQTVKRDVKLAKAWLLRELRHAE